MLTFLVNKIFIPLRISSVLFAVSQSSAACSCASFRVFFSMKGMLHEIVQVEHCGTKKKKTTHGHAHQQCTDHGTRYGRVIVQAA